jgi:hypothetical protein
LGIRAARCVGPSQLSLFREMSSQRQLGPSARYWEPASTGLSNGKDIILDCVSASVRLAFRARDMKATPRTIVLMGTRLKVEYPASRGIRLRWIERKDASYPQCAGCRASGPACTPPESNILNCINCYRPHAADSLPKGGDNFPKALTIKKLAINVRTTKP